MTIIYTNIFHFKALQNISKLGTFYALICYDFKNIFVKKIKEKFGFFDLYYIGTAIKGAKWFGFKKRDPPPPPKMGENRDHNIGPCLVSPKTIFFVSLFLLSVCFFLSFLTRWVATQKNCCLFLTAKSKALIVLCHFVKLLL
jgi:hypothetical protein